jgi:hypothetical protein
MAGYALFSGVEAPAFLRYLSKFGREATTDSISVETSLVITKPEAKLGYGTGSGGVVTQLTSRTTAVTINTPTGQITLFSAAGSATPASFTVNNSVVEAGDIIDINQKSGTDLYQILITAVAAGSFRVTFFTTGGTTTEQPVFNFMVTKGSAS